MDNWYLVGGAVRDLLLGRRLHDLDIAFACSDAELIQRYPDARKTGCPAGTVIAGGIEFTPMRGNAGTDSMARDITVNSAVVSQDGRLHAHPLFEEDMAKSVLRFCSAEALTADPLRVYRLARFAAVLPEWKVDGETVDLMRSFSSSNAREIASLPRERVTQEMFKAFEAEKPSRFFEILGLTGSMLPWFEELAEAGDIPAGPSPWHDNSVLAHTLEVMDRCAGHPMAVWMALCHDLGKIRTDPDILPHHYGHEKTGSGLVRSLGARLGVPSAYIRAGVVGTELHMKGGMYGTLRAGTRRDMLYRLRDAGIMHDFWILAGADGGWDWEPIAARDYEAICKVHLPDEWRGRGKASGERLRAMQCEALSRLPKMKPERAANAGNGPFMPV